MKYYRRAPKAPNLGRSNQTLSLKDALKAALKSYTGNPAYQKAKVVQAWEKVMGDTVAKRTGKLFMKQRKLFVQITSAPLKKELLMAKPTVLTLLNKELNGLEVNDIVFL